MLQNNNSPKNFDATIIFIFYILYKEMLCTFTKVMFYRETWPLPTIEILILKYQKCFQNGSDIIRWAHTAWCALPQSREGTLRFTRYSLVKFLSLARLGIQTRLPILSSLRDEVLDCDGSGAACPHMKGR